MNNKKPMIVANWKMNKSLAESSDFFIEHIDELNELSKKAEFIFLPSFVALTSVNQQIQRTQIQLGAQDCSIHVQGAYTGEVDAISLKEAGCSYVLIGHNERRVYHHETNKDFILKISHALGAKLIPIFCISEEKESSTLSILEALYGQLNVCIELQKKDYNIKKIIIAYEPRWAIGTDKIGQIQQIKDIVYGIKNYLSSSFSHNLASVLYGGSVGPQTIHALSKIDQLDGFLLGRASLDFQNLKNVVLLAT